MVTKRNEDTPVLRKMIVEMFFIFKNHLSVTHVEGIVDGVKDINLMYELLPW